MPIVLIGLNHRTAPVELREQLALTGCGVHMALEELPRASGGPIREGVILSTCNRLELYAETYSVDSGSEALIRFLARVQGLPEEDLQPHLYVFHDDAATVHLMRVAAGLDSLILGEPQILGQVAQALSNAQSSGTVGPVLSHLFGQAIHAGKRARTETEISRGTTSVSHAAALQVRASLGDLSSVRILIVGAGEMAELAARSLQAHGAQNLICINRTFARAQSLALQIGGQAVNWYHLPQTLVEADAVITATGAPHTVIHVGNVANVLPHRNHRPLLFVDIAVPRDVEEAVGKLPGVQVLDIDDLQAHLDENLAMREAAVPRVEEIIRQEAASYSDWIRSRDVAPVIADLRRKAQDLAQQEVEDALRRLSNLDQHDQEIIAQMAHRLVNKLLHEPTVRLKACASEGDGYTYAHAMRELFALNEEARQRTAPHHAQAISSSHGVAS